jgi:hypothetical protein
MDRTAMLIVLLAALTAPPAFSQGRPYYNVDTEVRVEGTVREIVLEPRYQGAAPFMVLRVQENGGARSFEVEVAPSWFFDQDVHGGEKVKIVGSLFEKPGSPPVIIARELQLRGETFKLRDKSGFPNWQGGPRRKRGIRRVGRP